MDLSVVESLSAIAGYFNVGWAVAVLMNSNLFGDMALPLIIGMEAAVAWGMLPRQGVRWSLARALLLSIIMNVVSAAVGLGLVASRWLLEVLEPTAMIYPSGAYYSPPPGGRELLWLKLTAVYWLMSVAVEGLVLTWARRVERKRNMAWPAGRTWGVALVANAITYLAVFVVYPFVIMHTLPTYL